jgi:hypothetical protein
MTADECGENGFQGRGNEMFQSFILSEDCATLVMYEKLLPLCCKVMNLMLWIISQCKN